MSTSSGPRVVLCRREKSMVRYRWTGSEPNGMFEVELAEELGARWEGDELVTYDLAGLSALYEYHQGDDYMIDND
ncbi:MAG: hypothetical protein QOF30_1565 [Acidimicrobiaceae bacterium]|jgi:hypothetical protein|nr:hypothetical protein [Acidimicrobiaceae bacterium]